MNVVEIVIGKNREIRVILFLKRLDSYIFRRKAHLLVFNF